MSLFICLTLFCVIYDHVHRIVKSLKIIKIYFIYIFSVEHILKWHCIKDATRRIKCINHSGCEGTNKNSEWVLPRFFGIPTQNVLHGKRTNYTTLISLQTNHRTTDSQALTLWWNIFVHSDKKISKYHGYSWLTEFFSFSWLIC